MKAQIKEDFMEESVLIASSIKWIILSAFAGVAVGLVTTAFLKLLEYGTSSLQNTGWYYFMLPAALFLSSFIILKLAPEGEKKDSGNVIRAIHKRSGSIDVKFVFVRLISTLVTLFFGGSAGKEGPCAQIGASVSSFFAGIFKLEGIDKKRFVICGVSAGVAGVFGTPIAGAIFAAEVIYVGKFSYLSFLPSLVASYISFNINKYFGIKHMIYMIASPKGSSVVSLLDMALFGIVIGIVSYCFIRMSYYIKLIFGKIDIYKPLKGIIGGTIIIILVLITGSRDFLGLGTSVIGKALSGSSVNGFGFLLKMFATSVTFGSGGSGGILTPIFYIGSAAGNAWAQLIHGNLAFYSAIGMVASFAACANTPITAIIMAMELFGAGIAPYASIACVISYLVIGHKSVYPGQVLATAKSPSLGIEPGCEIGKIDSIKLKRYIKIKNVIPGYNKHNDKQ